MNKYKQKMAIRFTAQDILNRTNISHFWDFGDGMYSIEPNPAHTYVFKGVYIVKHTAMNEYGKCTKQRKIIIE